MAECGKGSAHLYGRHGDQVGVGLGQGLGELQVQHAARHGPHSAQGAGPLLVAGALGRTPSPSDALAVRSATRVHSAIQVLVDSGVEYSPVDHLGFRARFLGRRCDRVVQVGRPQARRGVLARFGAVEVVRRFWRLAGRRRSVQEARKLLRYATLAPVL